jgi:prolyl-tRNA synthetase
MGALVMAHSDADGLVLPPKLAPIQVVMVPIYKSEEERERVVGCFRELQGKLEQLGVRVKLDDRDTHRPGFKFAEYELKGVPVRLAMGMRDLEAGVVEVARRDTKEKEQLQMVDIASKLVHLLEQIQHSLYEKALAFRNDMITRVDSWQEFQEVLESKGGFLMAHWDGTTETELAIKEATKATIRCIPLDREEESGVCVFSGKPSTRRVMFAKAY